MGLSILGIDPGTVKTGYGLIFVEGDRISCLDHGVISASKSQPLPRRVQIIHKGLRDLYRENRPDHTAVEKIFLGRNPEAAFRLGHIFALCLLESARHESGFFEYASRFVKQTVTCSGRASKDMTRRFVGSFFSLPEREIAQDAADALAVALCHNRELQKIQTEKRLDAARSLSN